MTEWRRAGEQRGTAWIKAEDGSYIQARHITRLSLAMDVTTDSVAIKASLPGPSHPFTISTHKSRAAAEDSLAKLVLALEG